MIVFENFHLLWVSTILRYLDSHLLLVLFVVFSVTPGISFFVVAMRPHKPLVVLLAQTFWLHCSRCLATCLRRCRPYATRCINKQQVTLPPVHWNWPWIWEYQWCLAALAEQEGHGYQIARGDRNAKLPYLQDKSLLFIVRDATALRTMMTLHSMSNDKQIKKDQTVKR